MCVVGSSRYCVIPGQLAAGLRAFCPCTPESGNLHTWPPLAAVGRSYTPPATGGIATLTSWEPGAVGTVEVAERFVEGMRWPTAADSDVAEGAGELVAVVVTDEHVDHVHQAVSDVRRLHRPPGRVVNSAVASLQIP